MKSRYFSIFFWIGLLIFSHVGCNRRTLPAQNSNNAEGAVSNPVFEGSSSDDVKKSEFNQIDLRAIRQSVSSPNEKIMENVVQPLAIVVYHSDFFSKAEQWSSQRGREAFRLYTYGLLYLLKTKPSEEVTKQLEQYKNVYLNPCLSVQNVCNHFDLLKGEPNARAILMEIVKNSSISIESYYNHLYLIYDLQNRTLTVGLEDLYIRRSVEYLQFIENQQNTGKEAFEQLLSRHMLIFSQILNSQKDNQFTSNIAALLQELDPLNYLSGIKTPLNELRKHALSMAMKYDKKDNHKQLKLHVKSKNSEYTEKISKTVKGKYKVLQNLNLPKEISSADIGFFLAQKVYTGEYSRQEANLIWQSYDLQLSSFVESVKLLIKLEMALRTIEFGQFMESYFTKNFSVGNNKLFEESINAATRLNPEWSNFHEGAQTLRSFVTSQMSAQEIEKNIEFTYFFESLDHNIRLMTIYPNMMMLIYYLSKADFREQLRILWLVIDFSSDDVIDSFFRGNYSSWFQFTSVSNDQITLNPRELVMAFYYAIQTDVFSIYGIDVQDFLAEIGDRLLTPLTAQLNGSTQVFENLYFDGGKAVGGEFNKALHDSPRNNLNNLKAFCQNPRSAEYIPLKSLTQHTTQWSPYIREQNTFGLYSHALYSSGHRWISLYEILEIIRLDLDYRLRLIEEMKTIYSTLQEKQNLETTETTKIDTILDKAVHAKRRFLSDFFEVHSNHLQCQHEVISVERHRQKTIMMYEAEYLKGIYQKLKALSEGRIDLDAANSSLPKITDMPNNYTGFDQYSLPVPSQYAYEMHAMDFMVRMKNYLTEGGTSVDGKKLPAIAKSNLVVYYPNDFNKDSYYDEYKTRSPKIILTLDPGISEEEFVRRSMALYNAESLRSKALTSWNMELSDVFSDISNNGKIYALSTMYKLGETKVYDYSLPNCNRMATSQELLANNCLKAESVTASDLVKTATGFFNDVNLVDSEERKIYKNWGIPSVATELDVKHLVYNFNHKRPTALLDTFHTVVSQPHLGYRFALPDTGDSTVIPRFSRLEQATHFFLASERNGSFVFPIANNVVSYLDGYYRNLVKLEFNQVKTLEQLASQLDEKNGAYNLFFFADQNESLQIPYLSTTVKSIESVRDEFHQSTENFYK